MIDIVTIFNDNMQVEVAVGRGGEIRRVGSPGGRNRLARFDGRSPLAAEVGGSYGDGTLDWLSSYRGGWQVLFPNVGAPSEAAGVPLPFHGEVSVAPWQLVAADEHSLLLRAEARLPFTLERTLRLDDQRPVLRVEEVARHSGEPVVGQLPFLWGHHPAFACAPGDLIDLPPGSLHTAADVVGGYADLLPGESSTWPNARTADGSTIDLAKVPEGPVRRLCYLPRPRAGWAALRRPASAEGTAMTWDTQAFPDLWLWQEIGTPGMPWYGRARITAIEPQSAWPGDGLAAHVARGTARTLRPGGCARSWLTLTLFDAGDRAVVDVSRDGDVQLAAAMY